MILCGPVPCTKGSGLRLILSTLLFIGATWLFLGVAEDIVTQDPLVLVDDQITRWFQRHQVASVTLFFLLITNAHGPWPIGAICMVVAIFLIQARAWRWLATLLLVLPVGMLLNLSLKLLFHRERPLLDEPLLSLSSFSFPSGHVTAATLFYGLLAAFLLTQTRKPGTRLIIIAAAVFMVLLVGITRIYLGVHYFSDVVAAAAWSTAWLILCLTIVSEHAKRGGLNTTVS